nr:ribosomal protein S11 [Limnocharis flava]
MAKHLPRIRIGFRKRRIRPRKNVRKILKGLIHVQAGLNNTIVSVTDIQGQVVCWSSAGTCGFHGPKKGTALAGQHAAQNALSILVDQGMEEAEVIIRGIGSGRDGALRGIYRSGLVLNYVRDETPLPHNGCRPPKRRRI